MKVKTVGNIMMIGSLVILIGYFSSGTTATTSPSKLKWTETEIVDYMLSHPQRAYFSHLFLHGGFTSCAEVGVAGGQYAQHMVNDAGANLKKYLMIEPFVQGILRKRFAHFVVAQPENKYELIEKLSMDQECLDLVNDIDFIYLDGAHDYENVKLEMEPYWQRVSPGGVLAGHDYCNYGEPTLPCTGCDDVPSCAFYTGEKDTKKRVKNQWGVVKAVQEWLHESHPELRVYHTMEDFTRESLEADGMDFDLILTKTRNPSWFVIKPL